MLCHANWNECFREWKGPVFDYTGVISRCGLFQTDLVVWSPEFRGSTWTRPVWAEWTSGKAGKGAALCPQILLKGKVSLCPMPCEGFGLGIVLSCCSLKVEEDRESQGTEPQPQWHRSLVSYTLFPKRIHLWPYRHLHTEAFPGDRPHPALWAELLGDILIFLLNISFGKSYHYLGKDHKANFN